MNMRKLGESFASSARTLERSGDAHAVERMKDNGGEVAWRYGGDVGREAFLKAFSEALARLEEES